MSLTGYAEEFYGPKAKKNDPDKKIAKSRPTNLIKKVSKFFDEWTQHSYEAWFKAGRPNDF